MSYLFVFNISTALVHLFQAFAVHTLVNSKAVAKETFGGRLFEVFRPKFTYNDSVLEMTSEPMGNVDVVNVITGFFMLSALFQSASAGLGWRWLRFIEYSFSASAMLVAIAVETGVRDVYTLRCMVALMWVTQLLGLMAEKVSELRLVVVDRGDGLDWYWLFPHAVAWVTCIAAYAPALSSFADNQDKAPDFVKWIVYLELLLFMSFGLVQLCGLVCKTIMPRDESYLSVNIDTKYLMRQVDTYTAMLAEIDDKCECAYIALSLIAKTLLGWIILAPIMAAQ
jgi:hypothetical protein